MVEGRISWEKTFFLLPAVEVFLCWGLRGWAKNKSQITGSTHWYWFMGSEVSGTIQSFAVSFGGSVCKTENISPALFYWLTESLVDMDVRLHHLKSNYSKSSPLIWIISEFLLLAWTLSGNSHRMGFAQHWGLTLDLLTPQKEMWSVVQHLDKININML